MVVDIYPVDSTVENVAVAYRVWCMDQALGPDHTGTVHADVIMPVHVDHNMGAMALEEDIHRGVLNEARTPPVVALEHGARRQMGQDV